jgi:hypothetical protein
MELPTIAGPSVTPSGQAVAARFPWPVKRRGNGCTGPECPTVDSWDRSIQAHPGKRSRGTFLRPESALRTCFYAALRATLRRNCWRPIARLHIAPNDANRREVVAHSLTKL